MVQGVLRLVGLHRQSWWFAVECVGEPADTPTIPPHSQLKDSHLTHSQKKVLIGGINL
jgi:hypothetical protein